MQGAKVRVEVESGVELEVRDLGRGPTVVLVAGFGLDHRVWDRQVRMLSGKHRVVCVDQRGHGSSDAPADGYDIDRLATDLVSVLNALWIDTCAVVGWSFGGQVAFRALSLAPERVHTLILVASNAVRASRSVDFPFGHPPEMMLPALQLAERTDRIQARRDTIAAGFAHPPGRDLLDFLVRCSLDMPSWAAIACYEAMLRTDLTAELTSVGVPVHQVIGEVDPVHSARGARWLRERLTAGRLIELEGAGHFPMFEAPDLFDTAITELLADRSPGA